MTMRRAHTLLDVIVNGSADAQPLDDRPHYAGAFLEGAPRDALVRLMRLRKIAGAADQRAHADRLEPTAVCAEQRAAHGVRPEPLAERRFEIGAARREQPGHDQRLAEGDL